MKCKALHNFFVKIMNAFVERKQKTVFIFALCYGQNILKEHKNLCTHGCMEEEKLVVII